jgi:hypothetical protein
LRVKLYDETRSGTIIAALKVRVFLVASSWRVVRVKRKPVEQDF